MAPGLTSTLRPRRCPGITVASKTDALGTVRGRIGYAVNHVLFYGTGGYAWIDNKISVSASA